MNHPSPAPLVVDSVQKSYGSLVAVDGVSFAVRRGECFGLLGPNGAGKTTLLSIVATLLRPDAGAVTVNGHDVAREPGRARLELGLVPQNLSLYEDMSALENLRFFGGLYGLGGDRLRARVEFALGLAGLQDRARDRIATFSGGMKRRINLAIGLVHAPSLVLLDEPTVGVDPQSRNHLFEMVESLKREGVTLVYTTHYMEEAERLCDRIAIVDHGRLVALGTRDELIASIGALEQIDLALDEGAQPRVAEAFAGLECALRGSVATITGRGAQALQDVLARCARHGLGLQTVTLRKPNLESVFLALTGRGLRD